MSTNIKQVLLDTAALSILTQPGNMNTSSAIPFPPWLKKELLSAVDYIEQLERKVKELEQENLDLEQEIEEVAPSWVPVWQR